MKSCIFFGHRTVTQNIRDELFSQISYLIESCGVDTFWVGHQGSFDETVISVLESIKKVYTCISCTIVIANLRDLNKKCVYELDTIFPEELEGSIPRFAIDKRNRWMIERSDFAITYVMRDGGAQKYKDILLKKNKTVIEISK
ncbi:MAG: hypothetical protein IJA52_04790 [Clostridia bacterium]|nr:hypothetical protein [Clostridia bacterium]